MEKNTLIGIDTWEGFLILLVVPLLFWHQRARSALRVVHISIFPVITRSTPEELPPPKRLLRLSRNQRFFLFTAAMLSLSLCYNGIHITERSQVPGKWLVFLDNTTGFSAPFNGETILQEVTSRLRAFSKKTHEADSFLLVTSSPGPVISDNLDRGSFMEKLEEVEAIPGSAEMEDLAALLGVMISENNLKGSILVSPRSRTWKGRLSTVDQDLLTIPDDLQILSGNAGFSILEITLIAGNLYEVYGKITSDNMNLQQIRSVLSKDDGTQKYFLTPLDEQGEGTILFTETFLPATRSKLSLDVADNLLIDNSVTIVPPDTSEKVSVKLEGTDSPFLQIALSSHDDFELLTGGDSSNSQTLVNILDKPKSGRTIDFPTLIIFPAQNFMELELNRVWAAPMNVTFHPGHPATRNARFRQFRAARILQTNTPAGFQVLASAEGIPVILAGTLNNQKTVIWNFDPEENSIYLDPAFPVLLRDTVTWLARSKEVIIESPGCPGSSIKAPECLSLIQEAGTINIPDLSDLQQRAAAPESENRRELGKLFLAIALFLFLFLTAERIRVQGNT